MRVSKADIERLQTYDWPGNVRELQNILERAVILARGDRRPAARDDVRATRPA